MALRRRACCCERCIYPRVLYVLQVRAVDHMSWSAALGQSSKKRSRKEVKAGSVNGHSAQSFAIKHDHLDGLVADAIAFKRITGEEPSLWKADVDSAFRRVPLCGEHQWAAGVAYLFQNIVYVAIHKAMPFGATSAVVAWHRVGALIAAVARALLHLPVKRYVDDYFAVERYMYVFPSGM